MSKPKVDGRAYSEALPSMIMSTSIYLEAITQGNVWRPTKPRAIEVGEGSLQQQDIDTYTTRKPTAMRISIPRSEVGVRCPL